MIGIEDYKIQNNEDVNFCSNRIVWFIPSSILFNFLFVMYWIH